MLGFSQEDKLLVVLWGAPVGGRFLLCYHCAEGSYAFSLTDDISPDALGLFCANISLIPTVV